MTYRRRNSTFGSILRFTLIILPLCLIFMIIHLRSSITALEYDLGQLQTQRVSLIKEKRELIATRAGLDSVGKVEHLASRKMGLGYPDRKKVFFIKTTEAPAPYMTGLTGR